MHIAGRRRDYRGDFSEASFDVSEASFDALERIVDTRPLAGCLCLGGHIVVVGRRQRVFGLLQTEHGVRSTWGTNARGVKSRANHQWFAALGSFVPLNECHYSLCELALWVMSARGLAHCIM